MSAQEIKASINDLLLKIEDEALLEACLNIMNSLYKLQDSQIIGYSAKGDPLIKQELIRQVIEASKRVKSGTFIKQEDLDREVEDW